MLGAQRHFVLMFFVLSGLNHFITLYYSGVKNADEAELRQVASEPVDLNVYNVNDFPLLSKLVARLVHILCGRIEDRGISKRNLSICLSTYVFECKLRFPHSRHHIFQIMNILLGSNVPIPCYCVSRNGAWPDSRPGPLLPQSD